MAERIRALARVLRGEDTRQTSACAKALRGLEDARGIAPERLPLGARMLARGLLTARLSSVGRDRPWPIALTRQNDPEDPCFVPRSLLPVQLNLSGRSWTTLGLPDWPGEAVVDPGGWLTPWRDGPSIAVWVGDARALYTLGPLPGWGEDKEFSLRQERNGDGPYVRTTAVRAEVEVQLDAWPAVIEGQMVFGLTARLRLRAPAARAVRLAFAIRPANPEGAAPIFDLQRRDDGLWLVDGQPFACPALPGDTFALSNLAAGDVYSALGGVSRDGRSRRTALAESAPVSCPAGQAQGAEIYRINLSPGDTFKRTFYACSSQSSAAVLSRASASNLQSGVRADWQGLLRSGTRVELPVWDRLLRSARTTLLARLDPKGPTAGTLGDHRPDHGEGALQLAALGRLGFGRRVAELLRGLPHQQRRDGAWIDDQGWDGTAQVVFAMTDHLRLSGDAALAKQLWPSLSRAGEHLVRLGPEGPAPGWSASRLGPAGRYTWDALWSCAALRELVLAARLVGKAAEEERFGLIHGERLDHLRLELGTGAAAAAPGRSPDSASASVLAGVWPLRLFSPSEPWVKATVAFLEKNCLYDGGLFLNTEQSGVHMVLTALLARARVGAGDPGGLEQLDLLAEQASPTGCWPEAWLPGRGGVAGDGESVAGAAMFALLARDLLISSEGAVLHLFRGADRRWWEQPTRVEELPTVFGPVDIQAGEGRLRLDGRWREAPVRVVWHKPAGVLGRLTVGGVSVEGEGERLEATLPR